MAELAQQPRRSTAPVWALVLSILGLCFFPLAIAGLIVGVVALGRTSKDPQSSGRTMAIVAVVIAPFALFFSLGLGAAVAVPQFIKYIRASKTAEAHERVMLLARSVATQWEAESVGPGGTIEHRLPASLPLTPPATDCAPHPWPANADPGWAALGFAPADQIRYSYQLDVSPDGRSFVARAVGDLDCDGATSRFEITGTVEGDAVRLSPLVTTDEIE